MRRLLFAIALGLIACSRPLPAESPQDLMHLPSFRDYLDVALFAPGIGYYASGRVDLRVDFRTFPVALAPSFGEMIAEQVFRMWEGMRRAGTIAPDEPFTVAEVGAGDGMLAETFLDYVVARSAVDPRWHLFDAQLRYWSFDRSPALSERQRERNTRFGARYEARSADATHLAAALPKGSITGVILSNELLDCFSVHKIKWVDGEPKVAFVRPSLARVDFDRDSFPAFLETQRDRADYAATVSRIHIDEVYAPLSAVPELAEHMQRYGREYAKHEAAVAYVNLGAAKFIHDAGEALKAGYVLTIDYGAGWSGTLSANTEHLRTYGRDARAGAENPYEAPTLRDITTDVNFGHVAAEGEHVGLDAKFFGQQSSLQTGTPILTTPPAGADLDDYETWANLFETWTVYKVLVQQKRGTDPAYQYPSTRTERL